MFLPIIVFLAIELYLFIRVLIPYFRYDQFQFWDTAGHYFAAWFYRQYLLPHFFGWNPFFFAGFPQGTYYGPLYHYLIALLSFPLGLPLAFKLITIASIAVLPFSIYYLMRKFKFSPQEASVMTALAMIPVAGIALANGGTLLSQFVVGLGSHALGLPLFLWYFGKLKEQVDESERISSFNFALLTLLAVTMVLLHFVIAFAAVIAALVLIVYSFNKNTFIFAVKHALVTFSISGFFLLPLIAYAGLPGNSSGTLTMGFFFTIPLFLMTLFGGAVAVWEKDERFGPAYFTLLALFALTLFLDFGQINLPMHAYRFIIFFLLLAMMLPAKLIFNRIENRLMKISLIVIFSLLLGWQIWVLAVDNPRAETNHNQLFLYENYSRPFKPYHSNIKLNKLSGRIFVLENQDKAAPRALEHILAMNSGNYLLKGLFAESSAHAGYLGWLTEKAFQTFPLDQEFYRKRKNEYLARWQNFNKLLRLFQINYILSQQPIMKAKLIKRIPVRQDHADYYLYKIGEEKLAEVVNYFPYFAGENWSNAAHQWFDHPDPKILVRAPELPKIAAATGDAVSIIEEKIFPARLKLKVTAKKDIPVLIKVAYFPRWRAYAEGKPIKIYQVAPSFMLVYGKGEIVLEYKDTLIDRLGKALTIFGLVWFGLEIFWGIRNRPDPIGIQSQVPGQS